MTPLAVTDLKQWAYCPRIVYYQHTMGAAGKPTYKMEEGRAAEEMVERLEARRGLREYGFEGARRRFHVWLTDASTGLAGKLDLLLEREDEAAVVEFKLTSGDPGDNHRMQLAAYALLVESVLGLRVRQGFFLRIPDDRVFRMALGAEWRESVLKAMGEMRRVLENEWCPPATGVRGRCAECEYANYCGDVW